MTTPNTRPTTKTVYLLLALGLAFTGLALAPTASAFVWCPNVQHVGAAGYEVGCLGNYRWLDGDRDGDILDGDGGEILP
jgi:hypothetical protein